MSGSGRCGFVDLVIRVERFGEDLDVFLGDFRVGFIRRFVV